MASIAEVTVTVWPETSKIAKGIERALRNVDARRIGQELGRDLERGLKDVEVTVDADTTKAQKEIKDVERGKYTAKVRVEVDNASVAKTRAAIAGIPGGPKGGDLGLLSKGNIIGGASTIAGLAPSVVPAIGSIVQAAGQLSGVLGLLPAAAGAAGLAMGTLKIATLGFGDAVKASGDPEKFAEALAKLSPNAQQAATAIQGLMPQVTQLKMTVQDAFFKGFGEQFTKLGSTYLPIFQDVMGQMSVSANTALTGVSKMLQTPEMQADIKTLGANSASAFHQLSGALVPVVHAFTDVATVGSSFLPEIAETVRELAERFSAFIANARETGKLHEWIQGGIDAFTTLKNITVDVYESLRGIFAAADSGGQGFLATVEGWTQKLRDFTTSDSGQTQLRDLFEGARTALEAWYPILQNLMPIMGSIFEGAIASGNVLLPILQSITDVLAANPGLITAVAAAYFTWSGIQTVIGVVNAGLALMGTNLTVIPGKAAAAGSSVAAAGAVANTGLLPLLSTVGLIVAGLSTIAVGVGVAQAHERGLSPEVTSRYPHLRNPREGEPPPPLLPGQNKGTPPAGKNPGDVVGSDTPGAVPRPGTNEWIIPGIDASGNWVIPPRQSPSGGREPEQDQYFTPEPPPPPPTQTYAPPTPAPSAGGGAAAAPASYSGSQTTAQALEAFARAQAGKPYDFGAAGPAAYDCSGFISDLYALVMGKPYTGSERYFSTEDNFPPPGFKPGFKEGAFNVGVKHGGPGGGHMAGTLPSGLNVESGGSGEGVRVGGPTGAQDFSEIYHLDVPGAESAAAPQPAYPTYTPQNPMPVAEVNKDTGGEQLGKDILTGVLDIFGFGSIFKSPLDFGAFGIFKGLAEFGVGVAQAKKKRGDANLAGFPDVGGGGGGGLLDSLVSLIPSPFGELNKGSPSSAPEEFIPGVSSGGTLADFATSLVPGAGEDRSRLGGFANVDNSVHMEGANFGYDKAEVGNQLRERDMTHARPGYRNTP